MAISGGKALRGTRTALAHGRWTRVGIMLVLLHTQALSNYFDPLAALKSQGGVHGLCADIAGQGPPDLDKRSRWIQLFLRVLYG